MSVRKITKFSAIFVCVTVLTINQYFNGLKDYAFVARYLISEHPGVENRIESYSSPGSIAAVINTPKMGTGGLQRTLSKSWECPDAAPVKYMAVNQCEDNRRHTRTHQFTAGSIDIQEHRKNYPQGQCLIITSLRSPSSWFGSAFLQKARQHWKSSEEMLQDYKEFLVNDEFSWLYSALPDLLEEFNAGTLVEQAKIMDINGGYSLIPAPKESVLSGCNLLFLRMEQSYHWPDIFKMLDPNIKFRKGVSRIEQYPDKTNEIDAIASYKLMPEEKMFIYNNRGKFMQDWFDAYGYMDDVFFDEEKKTSQTKITAVINTPKMGTGGLFLTLTENQGCHDPGSSVKSLSMRYCDNGLTAIRTHKFDVGSKSIQQMREKDPNSQCLIATAIRSPETWFASKYLESLGGCDSDGWPTRQVLLRGFRNFIRRPSTLRVLYDALPDLLSEFNAGSLKDQFKIMDENGGYSLLGPAPLGSSVAGCNLLFLRMEQSDRWPSIFMEIDSSVKFKRGESRVDQCPEFTEYIKTVQDYKMTIEEKENIYNNAGAFVREWFELYDFMNGAVTNIALA